MARLDWDDGDERWLLIGVWQPRLARFMINHGLAAVLVAALATFGVLALDKPHDYAFAALAAGLMAAAISLARAWLRHKVRRMEDGRA